jgi:hypothetical protein
MTPEESTPFIPQHTCTNPNCALKRVLSTPDLLETTLTHLPTTSILLLRHVSKLWLSLITTSPSLRLHLFLQPQWRRPPTDFQLLPCTTIPGLQIARCEPVHLGQWIEATMTPQAARAISRKIYQRPRKTCKAKRIWRSPSPGEEFVDGGDDDGGDGQRASSSSLLSPQQMADLLLTQPPLVGVQASVVVVDGDASISQAKDASGIKEKKQLAHSKLACDAGITLGFMAEAANFLLRDLELVERGGDGDPERMVDGKKKKQEVVVVFRAIVSFCAQTDGAPRMRSGTRFVTKVD